MECQKILTNNTKNESKQANRESDAASQCDKQRTSNGVNVFENRYNIAWPFRCEPSSGWTVPTTAVYTVWRTKTPASVYTSSVRLCIEQADTVYIRALYR